VAARAALLRRGAAAVTAHYREGRKEGGIAAFLLPCGVAFTPESEMGVPGQANGLWTKWASRAAGAYLNVFPMDGPMVISRVTILTNSR
jgi:hypothetical protein